MKDNLLELINLEIKDCNDIAKLDALRDSIYKSEKTFLEDKDIEINVENITNIPNGRFRIIYQKVKFECLFNYQKGNSLFVVFSGSRTIQPPEFKRWSWYNCFSGSMLSIADPMYYDNGKLGIGWYYGTEEVNYRQYLVDIVNAICKYLKISNNNLYFYASSGGCAAAINCAGLMDGSTAIAINPQIYLNEYFYSDRFKLLTNIDLSLPDKYHRNDLSYFIKEKRNSFYLLIENIASNDDQIQFFRLQKELNINLKYGIQKFDNLGIWLYEASTIASHNAQENQTIMKIIMQLCVDYRNLDSWVGITKNYLYFTELWRDYWIVKEALNNCINTPDSVRELSLIQAKKELLVKDESNLRIKSNSDIFHATFLLEELKDYTTYSINIDQSTSLSNDEYFEIGVKNQVISSIVLKKRIQFGVADSFKFITGKNAKFLQLKLYPSIIGQCKNKEAVFSFKIIIEG